MQVQITIDCNNDAFYVSPEMELGSILRTLAIKVENGIRSMPVMDKTTRTVFYIYHGDKFWQEARTQRELNSFLGIARMFGWENISIKSEEVIRWATRN